MTKIPENESYFLVDAPGLYGDQASVLSSFTRLSRARRAAMQHEGRVVVRRGNKQRGDRWLRIYEATYPVVPLTP